MPRNINPVPEYNSGDQIFYFKSGTNSPKDTFADSLETPALKNAHPVIILADGSLPNVFFSGTARQVRKDSAGQQIWVRDPVGGENISGQWELYDSLIVYGVNEIVLGSDGKFYISLADGNQGNDPTTPSPSKWSEIRFIGVYNASESYSLGDVVQETDGALWASQVNSNLGNTPSTDSGTNWIPAVTGIKIAEVATLETRTTTVIPQTGGGALTALRDNQLRDANTYTLPLAASILVNQTITISLPDEFSASQPTVQRGGSDTITDVSGTDTSILFDAGSISITLTSDGVSDWSL
ncbi:hypothetical protein KAR91_46355 [Candidatus Pacearchaeota archaeon]|nr:hypothetical protein [Candidatus Pacearchaeota archaeon]